MDLAKCAHIVRHPFVDEYVDGQDDVEAVRPKRKLGDGGLKDIIKSTLLAEPYAFAGHLDARPSYARDAGEDRRCRIPHPGHALSFPSECRRTQTK